MRIALLAIYGFYDDTRKVDVILIANLSDSVIELVDLVIMLMLRVSASIVNIIVSSIVRIVSNRC